MHFIYFRPDSRKVEELYQEWINRLTDHFTSWSKNQMISLVEANLCTRGLAHVAAGEKARVNYTSARVFRIAMSLLIVEDSLS